MTVVTEKHYNKNFHFLQIIRTLKASKSEMRHSQKLKLPDGRMLVLLPGNQSFETAEMIFRPYYVKETFI
jgi:hypothetical protein